MNYELISSLARMRSETLLREAALRRALRRGGSRPRPMRRRVARFIRKVGYATLSLGDALAETC